MSDHTLNGLKYKHVPPHLPCPYYSKTTCGANFGDACMCENTHCEHPYACNGYDDGTGEPVEEKNAKTKITFLDFEGNTIEIEALGFVTIRKFKRS